MVIKMLCGIIPLYAFWIQFSPQRSCPVDPFCPRHRHDNSWIIPCLCKHQTRVANEYSNKLWDVRIFTHSNFWQLIFAPYSSTCHSLLGSARSLLIQEKGNAACGLLTKWKCIYQKWLSWTANCSIWMSQGRVPLCHSLLGGRMNKWGFWWCSGLGWPKFEYIRIFEYKSGFYSKIRIF